VPPTDHRRRHHACPCSWQTSSQVHCVFVTMVRTLYSPVKGTLLSRSFPMWQASSLYVHIPVPDMPRRLTPITMPWVCSSARCSVEPWQLQCTVVQGKPVRCHQIRLFRREVGCGPWLSGHTESGPPPWRTILSCRIVVLVGKLLYADTITGTYVLVLIQNYKPMAIPFTSSLQFRLPAAAVAVLQIKYRTKGLQHTRRHLP
jgi:hypothetical protein